MALSVVAIKAAENRSKAYKLRPQWLKAADRIGATESRQSRTHPCDAVHAGNQSRTKPARRRPTHIQTFKKTFRIAE
jgi:hypothetical protein